MEPPFYSAKPILKPVAVLCLERCYSCLTSPTIVIRANFDSDPFEARCKRKSITVQYGRGSIPQAARTSVPFGRFVAFVTISNDQCRMQRMSWLGKKIPRFSLRELLMLTTICALLMPYIYSYAFTTRRIDLSFGKVESLVMKAEPNARIQSGSGGNERVDLTCLVPSDKSGAFFSNLQSEVVKHVNESGWIQHGGGSVSSNGTLSEFTFNLHNGSSQCSVVGVLLDKRKGKDWLENKDVDEVRFIILSPHLR